MRSRRNLRSQKIFRSLLILITTESILEQQQSVVEVVRNFFAYVMLSHRWEGDELAFERIKGQSVYDLPASRFQKVRGFCRQAATQGFDWAAGVGRHMLHRPDEQRRRVRVYLIHVLVVPRIHTDNHPPIQRRDIQRSGTAA